MSFSEWKKVKLGDIYNIYSGLSKSRSDFGFGYPFLTFKQVFNNYFLPSHLDDLVNSTEKERERCSIKRGDIFLTRTSETQNELGMSSVALKDYKNATFNGFTKRLRLKDGIDEEIYPEYIGYYLRSPKIRSYMSSLSVMTTRASLNSSMISNIEIELPTYNVQVEIGKILKVIDDKIELNNRMNKTLEEMSQAIFKSWFVDFEPFQDGEFEDSELGRIPKGWKIKSIGEITKIIRGASPRPIQDFLSTEGMPWLKISDATSSNSKYITKTNEFIKIEGVAKSRRVLPGTLILSNSATPGIPRVMLIEACVHDGWLIFDDYTELPKEYIYYLLLNEREKILSLSNGSVFRNLKTDILKTYKIVVPPKDVVDKIIPTFIGINKIIKCKVKEIENITNIRDTLLPKLMTGEIRVPIEEV